MDAKVFIFFLLHTMVTNRRNYQIFSLPPCWFIKFFNVDNLQSWMEYKTWQFARLNGKEYIWGKLSTRKENSIVISSVFNAILQSRLVNQAYKKPEWKPEYKGVTRRTNWACGSQQGHSKGRDCNASGSAVLDEVGASAWWDPMWQKDGAKSSCGGWCTEFKGQDGQGERIVRIERIVGKYYTILFFPLVLLSIFQPDCHHFNRNCKNSCVCRLTCLYFFFRTVISLSSEKLYADLPLIPQYLKNDCKETSYYPS